MHGAFRAHFKVENAITIALDNVSEALSNLIAHILCKFLHESVGVVQTTNLFFIFIILGIYWACVRDHLIRCLQWWKPFLKFLQVFEAPYLLISASSVILFNNIMRITSNLRFLISHSFVIHPTPLIHFFLPFFPHFLYLFFLTFCPLGQPFMLVPIFL